MSMNPRTIVCKLLPFKEHKLVMKNAKKLKNMNIFIDERFLPQNDGILRAALLGKK